MMMEAAPSTAQQDCHADSQPVKKEYSSCQVTAIQLSPVAGELAARWRTLSAWFMTNALQTRHFSVVNIGIVNAVLCLVALLFCNFPTGWLLWLCVVTQETVRFFLPLFALCCGSVWVSMAVHRFDTRDSMTWIMLLIIGEEIGLRCFSVQHSFIVSLFVVLLFISTLAASVFLDFMEDKVTLLGLTGAACCRFFYCHVFAALLQSDVAYSSGMACVFAMSGVALSKLWAEPSVSSENNEFRCSKITVIRRGNTSLDSAMQNHSSYVTAPIRRTSLPALGLPTRRISLSSMDLTTLGEVHGMISDIMVDSSLTPNVAGTLRIVADMISPLLKNTFQRNSFSSPLVTVLEKTASQMLQNQDCVQDQPDIKDDTPLSFKHRLQQQLGARTRRMSSSYTTTTSASGMPSIDHRRHASIDHAPVGSGASAKTFQRAKSYAGMRSTATDRKEGFKSHSFSQQHSPLVKSESYERSRLIHYPVLVEDLDFPEENNEQDVSHKEGRQTVPKETVTLASLKEDVQLESCEQSSPAVNVQQHNLHVSELAPLRKTSRDESAQQQRDFFVADCGPAVGSSLVLVDIDAEKAVSMREDIASVMNNVLSWEFPLFELNEKCNVLTQLAFHIFQTAGFFDMFKINTTTFLHYFRCLESGYHDIPYHNRIHASDVLHGVHYLTQHPIPGFKGNSQMASRRSSCSSDMDASAECEPDDDAVTIDCCLADVIPDLELMALYTAAAMHDYDHPGRTNAFLVSTLNAKALLYNDRSVLENHHAAASWSMLVSDPNLNFLAELDPTDFKRFRFIVLEEILSTDLKKHFDFITEWGAKISGCGNDIDWENESDRLLVGQMCIKLADISGPTKSWDLHCRWTERIVGEFYLQGDDEMSLGMPVSSYMDRTQSKVPQLQESFIKHLVGPLYDAYLRADIMPGEWGESDKNEKEDANEGKDSEEDQSSLQAFGRVVTPNADGQIPVYITMNNINQNLEQWMSLIAEEKEDELAASSARSSVTNESHNGSICNGRTANAET